MNATATAYNLKIDGMTGQACVKAVKSALSSVAGVKTDSVEVGSAEIHCDSQAQCDAACAAIKGAGYKATGTPDGQADSSDRMKDHKGSNSNKSGMDQQNSLDAKGMADDMKSSDSKSNSYASDGQHNKSHDNHDKSGYDASKPSNTGKPGTADLKPVVIPGKQPTKA